MILSGKTIRRLGIIQPWSERSLFKSKMNDTHDIQPNLTYGCGPAGYDVRIEFDATGTRPYVWMAKGDFLLASTVELFTVPNNVMGIVHDKSTWARRGLAVQNTVIEPGWVGYLTLELTNHGPETMRIELNAPIAQIVFHYVDEDVEKTYDGKYHNQARGPQAAR